MAFGLQFKSLVTERNSEFKCLNDTDYKTEKFFGSLHINIKTNMKKAPTDIQTVKLDVKRFKIRELLWFANSRSLIARVLNNDWEWIWLKRNCLDFRFYCFSFGCTVKYYFTKLFIYKFMLYIKYMWMYAEIMIIISYQVQTSYNVHMCHYRALER